MKSVGTIILLTFFILCQSLMAQADSVLTGMHIGARANSSTTGIEAVFDDNLSTYYKSFTASNGWVGIDLGTDADGNDRRCVVTQISWISRLGDYATLGLFEGANTPNFQDAVPLYLTPVSGSGDAWNHAQVQVSRAFRYLRYVGPNGQYCRLTELRFYGHEATGSDLQFYQPTNLPVLSVHTETGKDPQNKTTEVPASLSLIRDDGTKVFSSDCTIRYRGNGSYGLPKKGYRIKLAEKHRLAGSPAKAKKWTLIPSYGDKTLMRNMLSFDVSRRLEMPYTPFCQPVDVFVNGEYKGNFQLCDQLTVDKNRVNITEVKGDEPITDETLSGGYLFEVDANFNAAEGDVGFKSSRAGKNVTIKSPSDSVLTTRRINWLKQYFDKMEGLIYQHNFTDSGYRQYFDVETFIRYLLVNEYCGNTDTFWEMYLYKDRNDSLIYSGPVWDMDLTFDNDNRTHYALWKDTWLYDLDTWDGYRWQGSSCYSDMRKVVNHLMADSYFKQRIAEVWAYYRATGQMSTAELETLVEDYRTLLEESQQLNFKRWPILSSQVHQNYQALGSYSREVDYVKSYISKRFSWLDKRANVTVAGMGLTIPESGWATVYLPTAFRVPQGVTLFSVVLGSDDASLQLDTVLTAQPNRPYLMHGQPGRYSIFVSDQRAFSVPATDAQTLGLLTGTVADYAVPVGSYVLAMDDEGQVGFRRVTAADVRIAAKTAYLTLPAHLELPDFCPLDQPEGIRPVGEELAVQSPVRIYSLSGALLLTLPDGHYSTSDLRHQLGTGIYQLQIGDRKQKIWL